MAQLRAHGDAGYDVMDVFKHAPEAEQSQVLGLMLELMDVVLDGIVPAARIQIHVRIDNDNAGEGGEGREGREGGAECGEGGEGGEGKGSSVSFVGGAGGGGGGGGSFGETGGDDGGGGGGEVCEDADEGLDRLKVATRLLEFHNLLIAEAKFQVDTVSTAHILEQVNTSVDGLRGTKQNMFELRAEFRKMKAVATDQLDRVRVLCAVCCVLCVVCCVLCLYLYLCLCSCFVLWCVVVVIIGPMFVSCEKAREGKEREEREKREREKRERS
jgi:hypothetical protein